MAAPQLQCFVIFPMNTQDSHIPWYQLQAAHRPGGRRKEATRCPLKAVPANLSTEFCGHPLGTCMYLLTPIKEFPKK